MESGIKNSTPEGVKIEDMKGGNMSEKQIFDYSKLRGKIREVYKTEANFAKDMGLSSALLSAKLNSRVRWKQEEMLRAVNNLSIGYDEMHSYFFTRECSESEHMEEI